MPPKNKKNSVLGNILKMEDKGSCRYEYQKYIQSLDIESILYTDLPVYYSDTDLPPTENVLTNRKGEKRVYKKRPKNRPEGVVPLGCENGVVPPSSGGEGVVTTTIGGVYGFAEGIEKLIKTLETSIKNKKVSNITELISFLMRNNSKEPLTGTEIIKGVGMKSVGPYCKWHKKYGYYEILKTVGRGKYVFNPLVKEAISHLYSDIIMC
jgi:hypothetical protein